MTSQDLPQLHPDSSLIIWTNKCIRGAAVAAAPDHNNTEEQVDIEDASMSVVFAVALQVLACVLVLTWKSFTSAFRQVPHLQHQVASPPRCPGSRPPLPTSIVLEQNGERRILKKIKLLKGSPKFRTKPPEPAKKVEPPALAAKKMFVCTFCQSRFDCHGKLRVHFLKHGSSPGTGKNPDREGSGRQSERSALVLIECEWCPETFTTMSKAIEHKYRKQ
ncbi:hypothetical protein quinque_015417 [Culex quinquefasciatus]